MVGNMNLRRISRRTMKIVAALVVTLVAALIVIELASDQSHPINGDRVANALAQYTADRQSHGDPPAKSVTLDMLLRLGYLTAQDAKFFEGAKVIFYGDADDTNPQTVLVEARMPNGQVQAVLADGSVQQFSPQRWALYRKGLGQQSAAASESQPIRAETNRTPSGAGSRR